MTTTIWQTGPQSPALNSHEVHIWRVSLLGDTMRQQQDYHLLSDDEKERAGHYYFARHRRRFTVARAGLRKILSRYLAQEAQHINFSYSQHGKPGVKTDKIAYDLHFNVSHSGEIALYALTGSVAIGVDIEKISTRKYSYQDLAQRYFSNMEYEQLIALPASQQQAAFFHVWTQKEAFIKAIGEGLSHALDTFAVNVTGSAKLVSTEQDDAAQWYMQDIEVDKDYKAAFTTRQTVQQVNYWQLSD